MRPHLLQHAILALIAAGLLASQMLLKIGVRDGPVRLSSVGDLGLLIVRILTTPSLLFGYLLSAVVALAWLIALSRMSLSFAVPIMTAFYYLMLLVASWLLLGEAVGPRQWMGSLLIVLGIALLTRPTP